MTINRKETHGRINRDKPIKFSFDGKIYSAFDGDSLASALLANGIHLVARSFKYHRPRGFLSAGSEEPNALVTFDRGQGRVTSNVRATTLEIFDGLVAYSQNNWPSLKFDIGAINDFFYMLFPAGFYNKTFMWPKSFWDKVYEPAIRKMAGLGPAPIDEDADKYASLYSHCETLIVGSGPAGIAAALSACEKPGRVILIDEQNEFGGSLLSTPNLTINAIPAWQWLKNSLAILKGRQNVTLLARTTVIGYYHDNFLGAVERITDHEKDINQNKARECLHRIRAGEVILATGAIERPLVFPNNDRPGVMLASAARSYLNRYGVVVGEKIALFTCHDSGYEVIFDLADAGISIACIMDVRDQVSDNIIAATKTRGLEIRTSTIVTNTSGKFRISSLHASRINDEKITSTEEIICDCLLMCGGWTPSVHLFSHSKGSLKWQENLGAYIPDTPNENTISIGACNGTFGLTDIMTEADSGQSKYTVDDMDFGSGIIAATFPTKSDPAKIKAFVDYQNDVTEKDINLAVREGLKSIEHVKRYTTTGMATDQGKTSNLNALQITAHAVAKPVQQVGLTTFRPPFTPTTFGALLGGKDGDTFHVTRKTPIDGWADDNGAIFEPVALWRRARYFPREGEDMLAAVNRECRATRESLGIFDASTLGKIEVVGPDAAEFMNRMYTNPWMMLKSGSCRYGLMLGEDGYIMDDGVIGRMAEDRFHVTTTTGGAPRVFRMMEDYRQTEWPELDVWLTSTTEQWAVIALNGPNARKLLEPFVEGIDLNPESFPHMAVREGRICGVETRLFRVSFSGELGFEINVPAHYGRALWEVLFKAGQQYDITPYGTETMHVLRAEKGFIIVGQDTDGTVSPMDAGMSWAIGKKKKDFVGKRSLNRSDIVAKGRKQLVGLLTDDPNIVLEEGAQIVADPNQPIPMDMIGHVTSSYWSATLNRSIALAMIKDGRALTDSDIYIPMADQTHKVRVSTPIFYDPMGERLNVL